MKRIFWSLVGGLMMISGSSRATEIKEVPLTLKKSIELALEHNRSIKNAALSALLAEHAKKEAYKAFLPTVTMQTEAQWLNRYSNNALAFSKTSEETKGLSSLLSFRKLLKDGQVVSMEYTGGVKDVELTQKVGPGSFPTDTDQWSQGVSLNLSKPLRKGAGKDFNLAPLKIRELEELNAHLGVRSNQIDLIFQITRAYRQLSEAMEVIAIREQSLETAKAQGEKIEFLIKAGRMAKLENVQSDADIATSELNLLQAKRNFSSQQLEFLKLLDVEESWRVIPSEKLDKISSFQKLQLKEAIQIAQKNRPDILQAKNTISIREKQLIQAREQIKKQLNLNAGVNLRSASGAIQETFFNGSEEDNQEWKVTLQYSRQLSDYRQEREQISQSVILLEQAKVSLKELEASLPLELENLLMVIDSNQKAVDIAVQSRKLSEQKLEVERKKMEIGQSSAFQLLTYKNDLANARLQETSSRVALANAFTDLLRALGKTPD